MQVLTWEETDRDWPADDPLRFSRRTPRPRAAG